MTEKQTSFRRIWKKFIGWTSIVLVAALGVIIFSAMPEASFNCPTSRLSRAISDSLLLRSEVVRLSAFRRIAI